MNTALHDALAQMTPPEGGNMGHALAYEIERVTLIRAIYLTIPKGCPVPLHSLATFMGYEVEQARKALGDGNAVNMLLSYNKLKGYTL